jgi:tRNA nucleotidyltransferase/poly(A) polymerase
MNTYKLYEVGGCVRDSLMGLKSKDIDYTVVITSDDPNVDALVAFNWFHAEISRQGYEVFLCTPDVFTIRAKFPKTHANAGLVADFVLARKESGFVEGTRRPLSVELGSLEDDLRRRDFCMNAIARDEEGNLIDPFGGLYDIQNRTLSCPIDATTSFNDDPLRVIRALRFSLTKKMSLHGVELGIRKLSVDRFKETVSVERIREELDKMFRYDTHETLNILFKLSGWNPRLYIYLTTCLWLKPTTEKI